MKSSRLLWCLLLTSIAVAQTGNTLHVSQFLDKQNSTMTVGQAVSAAAAACLPDTSIPCILVLDPILAAYPSGIMPTLAANVSLEDWRSGLPWAGGSSSCKAMAQSGADECVKIAACEADLAPTGGLLDATGITGPQNCSVNPLAVSFPMLLQLDAAYIYTNMEWYNAAQNGVRVVGIGADATVIATGASFPANTPVGAIGDGTHLIFGSRFEQLRLVCNGASAPTGCTSFYGRGLNEHSGGNDLDLSQNTGPHSMVINGQGVTTQHWDFERVNAGSNVYSGAPDDSIQIIANGGGSVLDHITVNNSGATRQSSCIHVMKGTATDSDATLLDPHCENAVDGYFFDAGSHGYVRGGDLNTGTNVLHTNTSGMVIGENLQQVGGVTNTVQNDQLSLSITDWKLPCYYETSTATGKQAQACTGQASTIGQFVGPSGLQSRIESLAVNGYTNLTLDDSAKNGFNLFVNPNSGNPQLFLRKEIGGVFTNAMTLTGSSGVNFAGSATIGGATPTVSAGQLGVGTTTGAASSCGSLSGARGCLVINIAGTPAYLPYW